MNIEELVRVSAIRRDATTGIAQDVRQRAHVSQPELAEVLGVSVGTLNRWESGIQAPRVEVALRWADALDRFRGLDEQVAG